MSPYNEFPDVRLESERFGSTGGGGGLHRNSPNRGARIVGLIILVTVLAGVIAGAAVRYSKRDDGSAAAALFYRSDIPTDTGTPVIKRPYTVYGLSKLGVWKYQEGIVSNELLRDEALRTLSAGAGPAS